MIATRILWQAADNPIGEGEINGACRVCGQQGAGLPFGDWVRPTFTDWDKLLPGDILCHACQFSFAERSELLAERVGKDKLQRMRNYSHFVVDGKWIPLSKGDKRKMAHILTMQEPEVAIIAVSGQKHIIFRAQPGWWQVEEQSHLADPDLLQWYLERVEALYTGFLKSEIETGDYRQHRVLKFGVGCWRAYEDALRPFRGTALFELAVFLAQKKKGESSGRSERPTQSGSDATGGSVEGNPVQLQIPLP